MATASTQNRGLYKKNKNQALPTLWEVSFFINSLDLFTIHLYSNTRKREDRLAEEITMTKINEVPRMFGVFSDLFGNRNGDNLSYKTFDLDFEENLKMSEKYGDGSENTYYRIVLAFEDGKVIKENVQVVNKTETYGFIKPYDEVAALLDLSSIE